MQQIHCEGCNEMSPGYDIISVGTIADGYRQLCTRCYNAEAAKRFGLGAFENHQFEPIKLNDCAGAPHEFHFRTRLVGDMVSLAAFELIDGDKDGYQFELIADLEEELFALLGRLIERIRRGLSVKHIRDGELGHQIIDQTVRGRIEWDEAATGRMPIVVVDGRKFTWDQFGEMMMSFEGWQFKLEIVDANDEI